MSQQNLTPVNFLIKLHAEVLNKTKELIKIITSTLVKTKKTQLQYILNFE